MNTPKQIYYDIIKQYYISDTLSLLPELSFTEKGNIIKQLISKIGNKSFIINKALNNYEVNYIRLRRVRLNIIFNTLYGLCKIELEKETKK